MIYFLIYLTCLVAAILAYQKKYIKNPKKIIIGVGAILILLAGLRYRVGFDYDAYLEIFDNVQPLPYFFKTWKDSNVETGFLFLNSLVKTVGLPAQALFFIVSVMTLSVLVKSLGKYSFYPMLSLLLYVSRFFFVRDMGQIRSSLACVLILYSLESIRTKNLKKFIMILLIASSFHQVALLGIVLYLGNLLLEKKSNYKYCSYVLGFSFLVGILNLQYFILLFARFLPERYVTYLTSEYYIQGAGLLNPVLFMQIGVLIGMWVFKEKMQRQTKYYNILFTGYLVSTCVLLAFNHFGTLAGRLSTLFATFEILIIPLFIQITPSIKLGKISNNIREFNVNFAIDRLKQTKSVVAFIELKLIDFIQQKKIIQKLQKFKCSGDIAAFDLKDIIYYGTIIYAIGIFYLIFLSRNLDMYLPYQWIF